MKVSELIEQLKAIDPNRIVILSKDVEGNGYSPLDDLWSGAYRANSTYSGDVGFESLTEEDRSRGYGDGDVIDDGEPAVILCPVN